MLYKVTGEFFFSIINSTDQPTTIKHRAFIRKKKKKKMKIVKNIFFLQRYNLGFFLNNE